MQPFRFQVARPNAYWLIARYHAGEDLEPWELRECIRFFRPRDSTEGLQPWQLRDRLMEVLIQVSKPMPPKEARL